MVFITVEIHLVTWFNERPVRVSGRVEACVTHKTAWRGEKRAADMDSFFPSLNKCLLIS